MAEDVVSLFTAKFLPHSFNFMLVKVVEIEKLAKCACKVTMH